MPKRSAFSTGVWVIAPVVVVGLLWSTVNRVIGDDAADKREPVAVRPLSEAPAAADTPGDSGEASQTASEWTVSVADVAAAPAVVTAAGPFGDEWGVPVGYVQTEQGAQAAAVGWVGSFGPLMSMGPIASSETLRALLTDALAEPTIEMFRQERKRFLDEFGVDPSQAIWIDSPLRVDLVEYSPEQATVKVWSQLLMGAATNDVQVLWRTQTVTVVWERNDWRIGDVVRLEGPTPLMSAAVLPSPGTDFAELAQWTPAELAGSIVRGQ